MSNIFKEEGEGGSAAMGAPANSISKGSYAGIPTAGSPNELPPVRKRPKILRRKNPITVREDTPFNVGTGSVMTSPATTDTSQDQLEPKSFNITKKTRKTFAGKVVFPVQPDTYYKALLGKRKYEHYEKYLEGCEIADEIRDYGRKYWDQSIILQNEQTGAMLYLKYGK